MNDQSWKPISGAPKDRSIILGVAGGYVPNYIGRLRYGHYGEPSRDRLAWRCDSSGKFADPTHWMEAPSKPKKRDKQQ